MEIEIIKIKPETDILSSTKNFGIILNKATTTIKMLHWYASDYNVHTILGDFYEDLTDLFDKLQEEIIGTVKEYNSNFPMFNSALIQVDKMDAYHGDEYSKNHYNNTVNVIKEILTSMEFNNYVATVKSGINNTKEEILSRINKTNYLLSLV